MATKRKTPRVEVLSAPPVVDEVEIVFEVTATPTQIIDSLNGDSSDLDDAIRKVVKKYLPKGSLYGDGDLY